MQALTLEEANVVAGGGTVLNGVFMTAEGYCGEQIGEAIGGTIGGAFGGPVGGFIGACAGAAIAAWFIHVERK
ncbi:MAG: hypothetical protein ACRD22_08690 [Terriglobia bacterium]